jgi:hypothetical protein
MEKFFAPNIGTGGRWVRGLGAMALAAGGVAMCFVSVCWIGVVLLISAAFVLYEALRGWCLLRACKIKTRI